MANNNTVADFYTYHYKIPLIAPATPDLFDSDTQVGWQIVEVQVYKNVDVRNLQSSNGYIVQFSQCTQVNNPYQSLIQTKNPDGSVFYAYKYLVGLSSTVSINVNNKDGVTAELIRYTPKTINTAVQTSAQGASSTDTSTSHQTSTGSTQSTVNTFSVDASGGFFGSSPTGSLSLGYSRSWGSSQSQEASNGNSQGSGTSSSNWIR